MPPADDLVSLPDADVVRLAQEGRERAFRELVRRYERPVFSLVYRMVRDRETAEDLAQDAFIKVLNHIDRYSPEFKFSSWIFKIANNVAIDHLRRRRLDTVSMDGSPHATSAAEVEASTFDLAADQESALDELTAKELGSAIEAAIGRLRPEYRACIMLRHVEGRSYEEIASTLDLPLGTVKTYIHRARHELRRALEDVRA
ncbi:MAG TPA: sigma-70 family RNA polymerase sigma factor [Gemmatimonadaceae bacterium]|jgi:RNA polymerase sigma-70 factor (ECF subfamily)|nr:sigma-70 family RNA polymerase sigma factor [Gemmatimonadaceae bacterium]